MPVERPVSGFEVLLMNLPEIQLFTKENQITALPGSELRLRGRVCIETRTQVVETGNPMTE